MNMKRIGFISIVVSLFLFVAGCSGPDTPKSVSEKFWNAVQARDMESAKQVSTWDTVDYLKYLKAEKLHPERFELGEVMLGENRAEIATTLYTQKQGKSGIKVPGVTVLVKSEQGWRVDVKKTLSSVVKHTANNFLNQFNGFMQEGLKELDKALSESMKEVGKALEEGAEELRKELSKPLSSPNNQPPTRSTPDIGNSAKQI